MKREIKEEARKEKKEPRKITRQRKKVGKKRKNPCSRACINRKPDKVAAAVLGKFTACVQSEKQPPHSHRDVQQLQDLSISLHLDVGCHIGIMSSRIVDIAIVVTIATAIRFTTGLHR